VAILARLAFMDPASALRFVRDDGKVVPFRLR
jgi:hypothetical protein